MVARALWKSEADRAVPWSENKPLSKAQPQVRLIYNMHGQPFLICFMKYNIK